MEKKNLAYLKDNLLYLGFSRHLYPELEKNLSQRFPEFILKQETLMGDKTFAATLYFKRGGQSELYFFNRWDALLKKAEEKLTQTFYLQKGYGITFKEAFNLLEGRAVYKTLFNKEEQAYKVWLQLDFSQKDSSDNYKFKQFHERYGYNLEKTLKRFPIKELEEEKGKAMLLRFLEKGNRAEVTIEGGGYIERLYIEANPKYKTLNTYDYGGKVIPLPSLAQRFAPVKKMQPSNDVTLLGKAQETKGQKEALELFEKGEQSKLVLRPAQSKGKGLLPS
jgi:hypothetical protein